MKRRTFILSATGAVIVIATIPIIKYKCGDTIPSDPLLRPDALARFCDEKEIREIGFSYRKLMPSENTKEKLTELLLTDKAGKKLKNTGHSATAKLIREKIKEEFTAEQAIVVNGWVISSTEARQCALCSLM